jgi:8-amino-7-oxononanoate synthase
MTDSRGFNFEKRLQFLEKQDMRRPLQPMDSVGKHVAFATGPQRADPALAGETQLVFASNDYLGLTNDERVQDAVARAAREVGTGAGSARHLTGDTVAHHRLEEAVAAKRQTERAVVFSSGYATNIGTIPALKPDVIFTDELNHMCINEGCRLASAEVVRYDHLDVADLEAKMAARDDEDSAWLIVTDSVFSMDGDVAPLESLCDLRDEYNALLYVDGAHATGLYENGGGLVQERGLADRVDVQMGTFSKALASQGGYIAGSEPLVRYVTNTAKSFVFSAGMAPPIAAGAREALRISAETDRRDRLWENVAHLHEGLVDAGYDVETETQILPVMLGDTQAAEALSTELRRRGIFVQAVVPPVVPGGTSRIRVAPMATHTEEEIEACITAFRELGRELDLV